MRNIVLYIIKIKHQRFTQKLVVQKDITEPLNRNYGCLCYFILIFFWVENLTFVWHINDTPQLKLVLKIKPVVFYVM